MEERSTIHNEFLHYKMVELQENYILYSVSELGKATTLREACSINCKLSNDLKIVHDHQEVENMYFLDEWYQ